MWTMQCAMYNPHEWFERNKSVDSNCRTFFWFFSLENDDAMWSDASDAITFMLNPYSYYLLFKQLTLESESEGIIKSMRFFNSLETYLMMFLHSLLLNILFFSLLRSLHFNFYIPFLYSNSSSSSSFSIIIIICSTQVKVKILTLDTKICSLF